LYIEFIPNDIVLGQLRDYSDYNHYKVVYVKLVKDMFFGQIINYHFTIMSNNPLGKSTLQSGFNFKKNQKLYYF
jgi:hypothetical protein